MAIYKKKVNRSVGGNMVLLLVLMLLGAFMIIPFPTMAQLIFLLGFRNKNKLTEQQLIAEQSGNMTFYGQEGNM